MNKKTEDGKENDLIDIQILRKMNKEIRAFLEHSLSSDSFWEKWTAINFFTKTDQLLEGQKLLAKGLPFLP